VASSNVTEAIINVCKEKQITTICMGQPAFKMPRVLFEISKYRKFIEALSEMHIDLIIIAQTL
jgi:two-component system sensor histidine kinase KdpD